MRRPRERRAAFRHTKPSDLLDIDMLQRMGCLIMAAVMTGCSTVSITDGDYSRMMRDYDRATNHRALAIGTYNNGTKPDALEYFVVSAQGSASAAEAEAMEQCRSFMRRGAVGGEGRCSIALRDDEKPNDPYLLTRQYQKSQSARTTRGIVDALILPLTIGAVVLGAAAGGTPSRSRRSTYASNSSASRPYVPPTPSVPSASDMRASDRAFERQERREERREAAEEQRLAQRKRDAQEHGKYCAIFDTSLMKWRNACVEDITYRYEVMNDCAFGPAGSRGGGSRLRGFSYATMESRHLAKCRLRTVSCIYDDWVGSLCSLEMEHAVP